MTGTPVLQEDTEREKWKNLLGEQLDLPWTCLSLAEHRQTKWGCLRRNMCWQA